MTSQSLTITPTQTNWVIKLLFLSKMSEYIANALFDSWHLIQKPSFSVVPKLLNSDKPILRKRVRVQLARPIL